jgi:hypothetical protein
MPPDIIIIGTRAAFAAIASLAAFEAPGYLAMPARSFQKIKEGNRARSYSIASGDGEFPILVRRVGVLSI